MQFRVAIRKEGAPNELRLMDADSRFDIYTKVRQEGGIVTALDEVKPWNFHLSGITIFGSGVKRQQLIFMARNLAAMLSAGLSLPRALGIVARQSKGRLGEVVKAIAATISKGSFFHEALAAHADIFSPLFISMVKAGEESGGLTNALGSVAKQMQGSEELAHKVRGALIYPSIVMGAIVIVAILMLIFVVPTLTATFESLKVKLPLSTQIIVDVSNFLSNNILISLVGIGALLIGALLFIRSAYGKNLITKVSLWIPVVNELVRETYAARACRTLASLLSAGVPILNAIAITQEVVGTPLFASVVAEAQARVKKGESLSAAFTEHPKLFPIMMSDMIAVGEESGKLSEMLDQVATFYENDVGERTKNLSTIIEPALMLLIGTFVGIFAVSMIYPIYSLSSAF